MQLEIGSVYEGTVRSITNYGAFVEIQTTDADGKTEKQTGMVHISEIADSFVRDIHDFVQEQDTVRVKVLGTNPQGRLSLSLRQANAQRSPQQGGAQKPGKPRESAKPRVFEPKRTVPQSEMSFEDKLQHFKQTSEEKRCELRRGSERRGGSRSTKGRK